PDPTLLPEEPEVQAHYDARDLPEEIAQRFPASSLACAMAAEDAWNGGRTLESYAYARVGYHRGLDSLRGAGWKGVGPIPWEHKPNRGFLRALYSLGRAAAAIGETDEVDRITKFLNDSDATAVEQIEAG